MRENLGVNTTFCSSHTCPDPYSFPYTQSIYGELSAYHSNITNVNQKLTNLTSKLHLHIPPTSLRDGHFHVASQQDVSQGGPFGGGNRYCRSRQTGL